MRKEMTENKKTLLEKLAYGVMALQKENDDIKGQFSELMEKMAEYDNRDKAESILIQARSKEGAPSALITRSVEDFIAKRAQLMSKGSKEIEKVATLLEYIDENDGITLSDKEQRGSASSDPLGDWLTSEVGPVYY
jgi:hypothetical protein